MSHPANANLHASAADRELIESFEGLYLKAYYDIAGVLTIGYGTTNSGPNGEVVWPGRRITKEQADEYLANDLKYFEDRIKAVVNVPLSQHQFGALLSFIYNLGEGVLPGSELLRAINNSNFGVVPALMKQYNHARVDGVLREVRGLTDRRAAEGAYFLTPEAPTKYEVSMDDHGPESTVVGQFSPRTGTWDTLLTKSDTVRGLMATLTSLVVAIGSLLDPITKNPWLLLPLLLAGGGVAYAFKAKWSSVRAGR